MKWIVFRKNTCYLPRDKRLANELRKLTALFSDENIVHPSLTGWNKWFNQAEKKYPDLKTLDEIRNIVLRSVYLPGNDAESVKSLRNAVRALKAEKKDRLD